MREDIEKVLIEESAILRRLDEMARQITADYQGKDLTVVALMNGSFIFMADLLRRIPLPLQVDGWRVSSYQGTQSSGTLQIHSADLAALRGRHVLVLDDILDTGATLHAIRERLAAESQVLSIRACVLLRKDVPRRFAVEAEYVGFDIANEFVVGYGLDFNENYRNLPFVGVLTGAALQRGGVPGAASGASMPTTGPA